jgi:amidase
MNKSTFPLAEPVYVGKRVRDFSPFAGALATLAPGLLAGIHALVIGKSIPALQELFASGQLSAEQLLLYYIDRIQRDGTQSCCIGMGAPGRRRAHRWQF